MEWKIYGDDVGVSDEIDSRKNYVLCLLVSL